MTEPALFKPSRQAALARLAAFVPRAAQDYAHGRNTDPGPGQRTAVSQLSPYVRHRLITEQEIVTAVLARHALPAAEKYVQEVLWRTYWKGWLEMRPQVWARFVAERERQHAALANPRWLAEAEAGRTGIEGFDDWARELVQTGYLHNHARMWFASIWIFTLKLPWALGADFFLRHLIDADAASNTLSWRWVAGLQTVGKTYLATADNIARYTGGRFAPKGLATQAEALTEPLLEAPSPLADAARLDTAIPSILLVTHEDMHPQSLIPPTAAIRSAIIAADGTLSWGDQARRFVALAADDTAARIATDYRCPAAVVPSLDAATVIESARAAGAQQIVTAYAPVGPVAERLAMLAPMLAAEGVPLVTMRRDWDSRFWPHASKGFFPFKQQMPALLDELLARPAAAPA